MESSRTKKGEASRLRMLEAATAQFAAKGYHQTKVSDIVKAAGLTQAAFYLYFPSKEAVFSELVSEYRSRLKALSNAGSLVTPLPPAEVPKQAKQNLKNLFMFLTESPELSRIALFESAEGEDIKGEITRMVVQNLKNNQEAGHIRSNLTVEVAAECMVAMVERMVMKLLNEKPDPVKLADDLADVILYGILECGKGE